MERNRWTDRHVFKHELIAHAISVTSTLTRPEFDDSKLLLMLGSASVGTKSLIISTFSGGEDFNALPSPLLQSPSVLNFDTLLR